MSITGTGRFTPSFIHFLGTSQSRNFSWRISWKSPNLWFPTSLFSTPFPQSATHTSGGFCRPKCPLGRSICQFTTLVSNFTGKKFKDKNTKLRLKLLLSWKLVQQLDHQWCLTQTLFFFRPICMQPSVTIGEILTLAYLWSTYQVPMIHPQPQSPLSITSMNM